MNCGDKAPKGSEGNHLLSNCKFGLVLTALALASSSAAAQVQDLPRDAIQMCAVDPAVFASWFGGTVTVDAAATPADSLKLSQDSSSCDFHQWAERMFLWLTSRVGDKDRRVFHSSNFYTVSPPTTGGARTMTRNEDGKDVKFSLLKSKEVETGQAGNGYVLMATANRSLVYYESQVNNVYAYFLTAKKTGAINPVPTRFPITEGELDSVVGFASSRYGDTLSNTNALTVEVKAAWVEADGLDETKYITMMAKIPTFNESSTKWTFNGDFKDAKLALVGLHIAGSVAGNPNLVWTTFEHIDNAPLDTYSYKNAQGAPVSVPPNSMGAWLFSTLGCVFPNMPRMKVVNGDITTLDQHDVIGPIETCRKNGWGTSLADNDLVDNNTEVIAMNNRVRELLPRDDVRRNYVMVGATWGPGFGNTILANSTMETFEQDRGCNGCHLGALDGNRLSHLFPKLEALPPP
jgi:hypothetical protein